MPNITNIQLVEAFRRFIAEKWGYVYGGQGQLWTPELAQKWQSEGRSVPKGRDKKTYFVKDCARWIGHKVADCSGGIVEAARQYDPNFGDRSANTFKSQFTDSGPILAIPEIPGLAVWRSGHIGVYAGNGRVLEFRGTDYGCVETSLKSRDFTLWGKLKGVDYGDAVIVQDNLVEKPVSGSPAQPRNLRLTDPYMNGDDVKIMQDALNAKRFDCGKADGAFGPKTEAAVKAFQKRYLLTVDGIVGTKTRKELRI